MDELLKRIEALEQENRAQKDRIQALEGRCRTLDDRAAIADIGAKYADWLLACEGQRIMADLWSHRPGTRLEIGSSGVYEGLDRIRFYYDKAPTAGRLTAIQLTTPTVVLDWNGQTARGYWMMLCAESDAGELGPVPPKNETERALLSSEDGQGRRYRAEWAWQRMEMALEKENDVWHIRRLHIREIFRCPYDESWVSWAQTRQATDGLRTDALFDPASVPDEEKRPPEFNASFATTDHWQYRTDALPPKALLL